MKINPIVLGLGAAIAAALIYRRVRASRVSVPATFNPTAPAPTVGNGAAPGSPADVNAPGIMTAGGFSTQFAALLAADDLAILPPPVGVAAVTASERLNVGAFPVVTGY